MPHSKPIYFGLFPQLKKQSFLIFISSISAGHSHASRWIVISGHVYRSNLIGQDPLIRLIRPVTVSMMNLSIYNYHIQAGHPPTLI